MSRFPIVPVLIATVDQTRPGDERCPRRRAGLQARKLDGETLVLDREHGLVHKLNETASFVWDRCDGRLLVADVAELMVRQFDIDSDTARRDVATAVAQFRRLKLVVDRAGDADGFPGAHG
jgi:hypothetical protein